VALAAGSRVGPYVIEQALGIGGMGEVYRARDERLDRPVAIKALPAAFLGDADRLARFEREARLLASLNHPGIATIHDLETVDGLPHLVLELIDGETLSERLARGALPLREALDVGIQAAAAIEAAHEKGIVHRDLKPANVMITRDRRVKVLDFGLAKANVDSGPAPAASPDALATAAGLVLGTVPYMSPEQACGQPIDRRTDTWSLGCLLFECLTGRSTFGAESVPKVIVRILEGEPDWHLVPPAVPPRLRDLLRRCLAKRVDDRPRTIGDVRQELAALAAEMSSGSVSRPAPDRPSLAVLYFENLSLDPESGIFCAGITEDILTDLSKIKALKVASRNAVARYRDRTVDVAQVGADLGVTAVLEGSVRRAGDRVRISAQLVNTADGFHLWAERYDRQLADVFQVQEEIASAIAEALRVALTPAELEAIGQDRPGDVTAYELYLKGRTRYADFTPAGLREAAGLFRDAIAREPAYAMAWAGLADACSQMAAWGAVDDADATLRQATEAARRSIALNPALAEGHKALGLALRYVGDLAGADASLARALEANPRHTPTLLNLAVRAFDRADLAAVERCYRRALEIDPQESFAMAWLSLILVLERRPEEARDLLARLLRTTASPVYRGVAHGLLAFAPLFEGDVDRAASALAEAEAGGSSAADLGVLAAWHALLVGQSDRARALMAEPGHDVPQTLAITTASLVVRVGLGDWDAAIALTRGLLYREAMPTMIRLLPQLHRLADREPFAPRRSGHTLVWPLEAPAVPAAVHALFRGTHIDTGRPEGSEPGSMTSR
jgi:serine/threonine protein kinase/Flp pilus assembly protein TadD